jgi:hypothetical protein
MAALALRLSTSPLHAAQRRAHDSNAAVVCVSNGTAILLI